MKMCKNLRNVSSPLPSGKSQRSPSSIITAQLAATLTRGTRREHPRVGNASKKNHARAHTHTNRAVPTTTHPPFFFLMTSFPLRTRARLLNHLPHSSLPSREDHEVPRGGGGSADIRPSVSLSTSSSLCFCFIQGYDVKKTLVLAACSSGGPSWLLSAWKAPSVCRAPPPFRAASPCSWCKSDSIL